MDNKENSQTEVVSNCCGAATDRDSYFNGKEIVFTDYLCRKCGEPCKIVPAKKEGNMADKSDCCLEKLASFRVMRADNGEQIIVYYCGGCKQPCKVISADGISLDDADDPEGGMTGCGVEYELS